MYGRPRGSLFVSRAATLLDARLWSKLEPWGGVTPSDRRLALLVTSNGRSQHDTGQWSRCRGSCILGACRVKFKAAHFSCRARWRSPPASTCSYLFMYIKLER